MKKMTTPSSQLFQNPFLDPYSTIRGGSISEPGQRLTPLVIPPISTYIIKTGENAGSLSMINIDQVLSSAGITPRQPVLFQDENVGIELNLTSLATPTPMGQINAADVSGQVVGRRIPTNAREARDVLHLINYTRGGQGTFLLKELRQVAKNLDLPTSGNKDVLVGRIRNFIIELFNLPRD